MSTKQIQMGFLLILLCVMGVSGHLGYRFGKRVADKWWGSQPKEFVTKIEYREGPAQRVYVAKDGEEYDAVLRGWTLQGGNPSPCIELGDAKTRVLLESIWMQDLDKPCKLLAPSARHTR